MDTINKHPPQQQQTKAIASVRFTSYEAARIYRDTISADRIRIRRRAGGAFDVVTYAAIAGKGGR